MTASEQLLFDLAQEVKRVRDLQKEYFRTRDKGIMEKSKQAERLLDRTVADIIQNLQHK